MEESRELLQRTREYEGLLLQANQKKERWNELKKIELVGWYPGIRWKNSKKVRYQFLEKGRNLAVIEAKDEEYSWLFLWKNRQKTWRLKRIQIARRKQMPLCLKDCEGCRIFLLKKEILYMESQRHQLEIVCKEGIHTIYGRIKEAESLLGSDFLRIHRSYLVNQNHVKRLYPYEVELEKGYRLPIPQKKYKAVLQRVKKWRTLQEESSL